MVSITWVLRRVPVILPNLQNPKRVSSNLIARLIHLLYPSSPLILAHEVFLILLLGERGLYRTFRAQKSHEMSCRLDFVRKELWRPVSTKLLRRLIEPICRIASDRSGRGSRPRRADKCPHAKKIQYTLDRESIRKYGLFFSRFRFPGKNSQRVSIREGSGGLFWVRDTPNGVVGRQ